MTHSIEHAQSDGQIRACYRTSCSLAVMARVPAFSMTRSNLTPAPNVGFKQIDPSVDVGFDLSKEYEQARALRQAERG